MSVNMQAILVGLLAVSHTPEQADHAAREVLNQHARQLAERQRNWDAEGHGYTDPQMAVYAVADLIDPEAQRASTEGDTP